MNKAGIAHRKDAESAKGKLIFLSVKRTERNKRRFQEIETMSNPLFRCLLLFSALSAESHKKVYLSVLCVSAVNYCNIFKCIVPLTPEAAEQVTEQATMQDERIKKITKEKKIR